MRCLLSFCLVLRHLESPNVLLIVGTESQDGAREGMQERAVKGYGKANGCLATKRRMTH